MTHTLRSTSACRVAMVAAGVLAFTACNDGTSPANGSPVGLGFQVARTSTAASMASAAFASANASADGSSSNGAPFTGSVPTVTTTAAGTVIARGTDTVLITKAQLVVRDVRLKSATASCSDDDDFVGVSATVLGGVISADVTSRRGDDDAHCPVVRIGPFLVDVPVNGADGARIAVPVPEGTYSSVRLTLHKVTSSDSADAAFRIANPDFRDISVRMEGMYNGTPFTFVSDVNAKISVPLTDPITIASGGANVTVAVDFSLWFFRPQGGLYSPAAVNIPGSVRAAVQNNIRFAFRAFRDRDRDGRAD